MAEFICVEATFYKGRLWTPNEKRVLRTTEEQAKDVPHHFRRLDKPETASAAKDEAIRQDQARETERLKLEGKTINALKALASDYGLAVSSRARKDEIVDAILQAKAEKEAAAVAEASDASAFCLP